jgi:hypothetical protein
MLVLFKNSVTFLLASMSSSSLLAANALTDKTSKLTTNKCFFMSHPFLYCSKVCGIIFPDFKQNDSFVWGIAISVPMLR